MMTHNLLLEVGSDEIPARYLLPAIEEIRVRAEKALADARLTWSEATSYGTPRRLVLYVTDLSDRSSDITVKVRGPSRKVAYDSEGMPTKALQGFCRSLGIDVSDVVIEPEANGEYVYGFKHEPGQTVTEILPTILSEVVMGMDCPHPLRWGEKNWRWFRPIRWAVCLYGEEEVPVELAGITSGRTSYGSRSLHPESLEIPSASEYFDVIARAGVVVDHNRRRQIISEGACSLAKEISGRPLEDEGLLDEVTCLCEHPAPFRGEFSPDYLNLPQEVLITVMRYHQRYFPILDDAMNVLPGFIGVRDGSPNIGMDNVRKGNEWVLRARLDDASFFYDQDLKVPLGDRLDELKRVFFLGEAGTLYDKTQRLIELSAFLGEEAGFSYEQIEKIKMAAHLSKCDLVTLMVRELPELEGIMGGHYARVQGVDEEVAKAIAQQYLPRGASDELPEKGISGILAIADKLDTLAVAFCLGVEVSGSQDPLGLRRAASGVANIILAHGYDIDLDRAIEKAVVLGGQAVRIAEKADEDVDSVNLKLKRFILSRVEAYLTEKGYPAEIAKAVIGSGETRISRLPAMAEAIYSILGTDMLIDVVTGWRRTAVLGSKSSERDVRGELLVEEPEKALFSWVSERRETLDRLFEDREYALYLEELASLRMLIDDCLDHVLIMTEDEELRENRIKLLGAVSDLFTRMADFSYILPFTGKM